MKLHTMLLAVYLGTLFLSQGLGGETPTDSAITETVRKRIAYDDAIELDEVRTVTSQGVVTLAGLVDSLLAKMQATRIAESVVGTRSVINRLQVQGVAITDAEIAQDTAAAIQYNPALDADTIRVTVTNGIANLSGSVQSYAEAELARRVVASVAGVKKIESDNMRVEHVQPRSDAEIAADVRARLANSVLVDSQLVKFEVREGHVKLTGKVPTLAQRRLASSLASVAGVSRVDDSQLAIDPSLVVGVGRQLSQPKNARQLEKAVQDALRYDPRVNLEDIQISVKKGVVYLAGQVATSQARNAAVEDAKNTVGVWQVRDGISVRPAEDRLDSEIAEDVRVAFMRDPYLSSTERLSVECVDGHISLEGRVSTLTKRRRAVQLAGEVRGAKSVANHLEVTSNQTEIQDPLTLKYRIANRLYWNPLLDGCEISVAVDSQGAAILTGWVSDSGQFKAAKRIALDTGATQVDNRLMIGK